MSVLQDADVQLVVIGCAKWKFIKVCCIQSVKHSICTVSSETVSWLFFIYNYYYYYLYF